MALWVQKFGGTSVGSLEKIQHIADKVAKAHQAGHQIVVVLSAMGESTNQLLSMARDIQERPEPREYSVLLSTGEQVSIALMAMALQQRGVPARSFTGREAGIQTSDHYKKARIAAVDAADIRKALAAGMIPVVAGFQGVNEVGETTTLGRGGSDTTAVALAVALEAEECQIFTDVDGVYTADPRMVPQAQRLDSITFEEMLELSSLGAKVLQIRAVEFAGKHNVRLRVLSTFQEGPGTLITYDEDTAMMEAALVSGIAYNRSEAKITLMNVPDQPGLAAKILGPVSSAGISIDMIIQNGSSEGLTDFTFTVHRDEYQAAVEIIEQHQSSIGHERILGDAKIAKLSIVGLGMRSHSGVANTLFRVLGEEGISIQLISTSEIKVSVVVDEKYLELGVRSLHTAFSLDRDPIEETDPLVVA